MNDDAKGTTPGAPDPTSGLPPSMVGTLVLVAMCLVAIAGFLLLR